MDQVVHELHNLEGDVTQTAHVQQLLSQLHELTKLSTTGAPEPVDSGLAVSTLGYWALDWPQDVSRSIRTTALRCLHNILYLSSSARQVFVDARYPKQAMMVVKHSDAAMAAIAMLTLCRLRDTTFDYTQCLEDHSLMAAVQQNIACEAEAGKPLPNSPSSLLNASLLFLTTIAAQCEQSSRLHMFLQSQEAMLQLLARAPILSPPMQPPLSLLMHAIGVTISQGDASTHENQLITKSHVDKVATALLRTMQMHRNDEGFEVAILPPVELLCSLAHICDSGMRQYLTHQLLPSAQDHLLVLGQGHTLPHLLIKIATQALRMELKVLLAKLFLGLCGNDPDRLVTNVGYGCASGLLFVLNHEGFKTLSAHAPGSDSVNPVTGQMRDAEAKPEEQNWTDDEKQREAERLFVLFERLKATGVRVENPVIQAAAGDRFEEIEEEQ